MEASEAEVQAIMRRYLGDSYRSAPYSDLKKEDTPYSDYNSIDQGGSSMKKGEKHVRFDQQLMKPAQTEAFPYFEERMSSKIENNKRSLYSSEDRPFNSFSSNENTNYRPNTEVSGNKWDQGLITAKNESNEALNRLITKYQGNTGLMYNEPFDLSVRRENKYNRPYKIRENELENDRKVLYSDQNMLFSPIKSEQNVRNSPKEHRNSPTRDEKQTFSQYKSEFPVEYSQFTMKQGPLYAENKEKSLEKGSEIIRKSPFKRVDALSKEQWDPPISLRVDRSTGSMSKIQENKGKNDKFKGIFEENKTFQGKKDENVNKHEVPTFQGPPIHGYKSMTPQPPSHPSTPHHYSRIFLAVFVLLWSLIIYLFMSRLFF